MENYRNIKMKSDFAEQEVRYSTGVRFERYAQYLLALAHPNTYVGTRLQRDGGVDGVLLYQNGARKKPPAFYSIYGPEHDGGNWTRKRRKLFDDVDAIERFTDGYIDEYSVCFILNFELSVDQIKEIKIEMERREIPFVCKSPRDLFAGLTGGEEQLLNALTFIHGIERDAVPLLDEGRHIFAGRVLEEIVSLSANFDTGDTINRLRELKWLVLRHLPEEVFQVREHGIFSIGPITNTQKVSLVSLLPQMDLIRKWTEVPQGCRTVYLVDRNYPRIHRMGEKEFSSVYREDLRDVPAVFIESETSMGVNVENLAVLLDILHLCQSRAENGKKFSLFGVLQYLQQKFPYNPEKMNYLRSWSSRNNSESPKRLRLSRTPQVSRR